MATVSVLAIGLDTTGAAATTSTPGVTATSVTVGNVSTITGIPGLNLGGQDAIQAYFAYVNSMGGVDGRKLKVILDDDADSCSQNGSETSALIPQVIAFVAQLGEGDACGDPEIGQVPDLADISPEFTPAQAALENLFPVSPQPPGFYTSFAHYLKKKFPKNTVIGGLYGVGSSFTFDTQMNMFKSLGYKVAYTDQYTATQTDFTADILRMKSLGVNFLWLANGFASAIPIQINQAYQQGLKAVTVGFLSAQVLAQINPQARSGVLYNSYWSNFIEPGADKLPETQLFLKWMHKTHPSFTPDLFAMFGWAQSALFVQALRIAGPNPTRAKLVDALHSIHVFSDNGFVAPANPGQKIPSNCTVLLVSHANGSVSRFYPSSGYNCTGKYYYASSPSSSS